MGRSLLLAALSGVATAAQLQQQPLQDAAVLVQRTALLTAESNNPFLDPIFSSAKNAMRTVQELSAIDKQSNPDAAKAIAGKAIRRALPSQMRDLVDDVKELAIKEKWQSKNHTEKEVAGKVLELAWKRGLDNAAQNQEKVMQTVGLLIPEETKGRFSKAMGKFDIMRKTVSEKVQQFSTAAQQTLPDVMQQVYTAAQQAVQTAQGAQQASQPQQLPWGPAGQAAGPQMQQPQQQFMPQMQQPQAMQQMPAWPMQQTPPTQYGAMPQQMPYGAAPQQMPYGAMPQQMPMQQWAPQAPQAPQA